MTTITYYVGEHDGGDGYRLRDVWSETFSDHDAALVAAKSAAQRQHVEGRDAEISYQLVDGRWQTEHADGGDRPDTEAVDDGKGPAS
ncbi:MULTISPECIES: hypothetical protein [Rhizobium]|uniref:hypothetical protein n=1 Tax=Rhizobium TaxID=379 RepID=UPI00195EB8FB|nr:MULTISPECIES: hypothetical protein [Rhizobium]MBM7046636.1 hypothetical protein [Rhizobium lusitanum]